MNYRLISIKPHGYVECQPGATLLSRAQDALDLVAACGEYEVDRLLLPDGCLGEDFYNLSSGLAGEVLLKFTNYRIKAAAVIPTERVGKGKFYEFSLETNRGREFRIFSDQQKAVEWLIRD